MTESLNFFFFSGKGNIHSFVIQHVSFRVVYPMSDTVLDVVDVMMRNLRPHECSLHSMLVGAAK